MSFESLTATTHAPYTARVPDYDQDDARLRLLDGIAKAVAAKGYAATTIADIVAQARVSKRTFYQHYSGKEACFSALYVAASTRALHVLQDALSEELPWEAQVERAISAYFATLAENHERARTLYIEVLRMGLPGLVLRRASHARFATWIVEVVAAKSTLNETQRTMALSLAEAVVGGIHELVLKALEGERTEDLSLLVAPASRLVLAVFGGGVSTQR
jgi:AcrR family transcriptional regulator